MSIENAYTRYLRRRARSVRRVVLERDLFACVWCSTPLTLRTLTLDHVVLKSENGSAWEGNLVAACAACNGERSDVRWGEWLVRCQRRGAQLRPRLAAQLARRAEDPRATRDGLMRSLGMSEREIRAYFEDKARRAAERRRERVSTRVVGEAERAAGRLSRAARREERRTRRATARERRDAREGYATRVSGA